MEQEPVSKASPLTLSQEFHLSPGKKVLLFGLSGNPPTGKDGHAGIVEYLVGLGEWDEIWVMPVYKHMHSHKSNLIEFEHRMNMCKLNFEHLGAKKGASASGAASPGKRPTIIRVVQVEEEVALNHLALAERLGNKVQDVRVGTIDVVSYLRAVYPQAEFSLTLGTDTYNDLRQGKWKKGAELLKMVKFVVIARPGQPLDPNVQQTLDVQVHSVPQLTEISSTRVRNSTDERFLREALNPKVLEYIKTHGLYSFELQKKSAHTTKVRIRYSILAGAILVGIFLLWRSFRPEGRLHQPIDIYHA